MSTSINSCPSLFVSHGAPSLILEDVPARRFLQRLETDIGRPKAILVVSAHWETDALRITTAAAPETIHDFYGFPAPLYDIRYPAPGAPWLVERAIGLLQTAGATVTRDPQRGLDHGVWAPLILIYPDAAIPVVQLSLLSRLEPADLFALGRSLAPLRSEGVLVMGSGSLTHNLAEIRRHGNAAPPAWVTEFAEWIAAAIAAGRTEELLDYRRQAPHALRNHPTEEHLLPLFVAMGAAGPDYRGQRAHNSYTYSVLAMDSFVFTTSDRP